jgi:hypothetical protein
MELEEDHEYHVNVGKSILRSGCRCNLSNPKRPASEVSDDEVFCTLRYEFQPASIDTSMPGLITIDESNGIQIQMGNSSQATGVNGGINFKGKIAESKDTDCLLIFDGQSFRIEQCAMTCTQLRHVRAPTKRPSLVKKISSSTSKKRVRPVKAIIQSVEEKSTQQAMKNDQLNQTESVIVNDKRNNSNLP